MITIEESFGIIQKLLVPGFSSPSGIAAATPDHFSRPLSEKNLAGRALRFEQTQTLQQALICEQDVLGTTHLNMKRVFLPLVLFVLSGFCHAEPFRIVAYGDSITYGWVPNANPPSSRYDFDDRWPGALQNALGSNYQVIEEGLDGRTTDAPDPGSPITGAQLDGSAYLQACLASHLPVDLVIIMLGTNDLKPVFDRTPLRIAMGAAHLIDLVNTLNGGVGTTYKNPKVLLICPPALNPEIEQGPIFGPMFKDGLEKSKQ